MFDLIMFVELQATSFIYFTWSMEWSNFHSFNTQFQGLCSIRICQVSNNIQTKPPNWNENKSMM